FFQDGDLYPGSGQEQARHHAGRATTDDHAGRSLAHTQLRVRGARTSRCFWCLYPGCGRRTRPRIGGSRCIRSEGEPKMRANKIPTEEIKRDPAAFDDRVTTDGRHDRTAEPGRYRLVINRACPWAHRVVITRRLMGLEEAVSLAVTDPRQEIIDGEPHWVFTAETGSPEDRDPVLGI